MTENECAIIAMLAKMKEHEERIKELEEYCMMLQAKLDEKEVK